MRALGLCALALALYSCHSFRRSDQEFTESKRIYIDSYPFVERIESASDAQSSHWYSLELRPESLPYQGPITKLTAQQRWMKLFKETMSAIDRTCHGQVAQQPVIESEATTYRGYGYSLEHPSSVEAKFACK